MSGAILPLNIERMFISVKRHVFSFSYVQSIKNATGMSPSEYRRKYKNLNWFCQNKAYRQGRKRGNMPFIDRVAFCTPTLTDFVEKHIVLNYELRLGVVEIYLILCEYFDGEILEDEGGVLWGTKGRGFGNAFLCLKKRRSL